MDNSVIFTPDEESRMQAIVDSGFVKETWPYFEGEKFKLWVYRFDYSIRALGWCSTAGSYPKHIAMELMKRLAEKWPSAPDAYNRPPMVHRDRELPLGPMWPVYEIRKTTEAAPVPFAGKYA